MYVIIIETNEHPLGWVLYKGFKVVNGISVDELDIGLHPGVIVHTFENPGFKYINATLYPVAEFANIELNRIKKIVAGWGKEVPNMYVAHVSEIAQRMMDWK